MLLQEKAAEKPDLELWKNLQDLFLICSLQDARGELGLQQTCHPIFYQEGMLTNGLIRTGKKNVCASAGSMYI